MHGRTLATLAAIALTAPFALTAGAAPEGTMRAGSDELGAEVTACAYRNVPEPDTVRAIRLVSRDRAGVESVTALRVFGRRGDDGLRRLLVRYTEPAEMQGAAFLMLERPGQNELYFKSSELGGLKRIGGGMRANSLGGDFSFEDIEFYQGFQHPGESQILDEARVSDRPVWVVEQRPGKAMESSYERVVAFVDKETCIPLRMELYESDNRLRKVFSANPTQVFKRGEIWIAHMALMRDIRDYTTTQMLVDSSETKPLDDEIFSPRSLADDGP